VQGQEQNEQDDDGGNLVLAHGGGELLEQAAVVVILQFYQRSDASIVNILGRLLRFSLLGLLRALISRGGFGGGFCGDVVETGIDLFNGKSVVFVAVAKGFDVIALFGG
jgi:hypothetical protein